MFLANRSRSLAHSAFGSLGVWLFDRSALSLSQGNSYLMRLVTLPPARPRMSLPSRFIIGSSLLLSPLAVAASQQANDSAYTAQIRSLTSTDPKWKFTTELVDHLPASKTVPVR